MQIYLDYSATTPPRKAVVAAMQTALCEHWGNASSLHQWGSRAATLLEQSRLQVASLIGAADPDSIVLTSGGTEANNLAIAGVTRRSPRPQHIVVSAVEHSAVSMATQQLADTGWQVTYLPVDAYGLTNPADLERAIRPDTALISVIYGQSEVGTLQPIEQLGAIARQHNILFHTDAVQVAGRLPIDVQSLPVDLLSLSSHKIYGPQGAGALYVRPGIELVPLLSGGGQERGRRSGTQAIPAIAGFGVAAEMAAAEMASETLRLIHLRDRLFSQLSDLTDLKPTGHPRQRLPHHVSFCWPKGNLTGKFLVRQMNLAGIAISAGSACHSGQLSPSPILTAMGLDEQTAISGIRLTLGRLTTAEDIDWTAMVLRQILARSDRTATQNRDLSQRIIYS